MCLWKLKSKQRKDERWTDFTDSCLRDISVKVLKMEQTTDVFLGVLLVLFCTFFVFQLRDLGVGSSKLLAFLAKNFHPSYLS